MRINNIFQQIASLSLMAVLVIVAVLAAAQTDTAMAANTAIGSSKSSIALSKSFNPTVIDANGVSTLTIILTNYSSTVANLTAPLVDLLPRGMVVTNFDSSASTTCGGVLTTDALGASVTLTGGSIRATGSCTVKVDVTAPYNKKGTYLNKLSAGALKTDKGRGSSASAMLTVKRHAPVVTLTSPADAEMDVLTNTKISATFSDVMDPLTLTTKTFTLNRHGAGLSPLGQSVSGTVASAGRTSVFTPTSRLSENTVYTARITNKARDFAGNAMASDYVWSFTTGTAIDTEAPTVSFTDPADGDIDVALSKRVSATFSEAMDPLTLTNANITVTDGVTFVSGTVLYIGLTVTFTPDSYLAENTTYTARISTAVKDLAGNALATDYVWSFTTIAAAAAGPQPVDLGTAGKFVILSKAGISTTGASAVVGDMGVSPIAATGITGFGLILDASNEFSTSSLVTGHIYAADYAPPTPAQMTTAISDMETAFVDAAGRTLPDFTELGAGNISGLTLAPGLYKWSSGVLITSSGVTLSGGADDVWIFQIARNLTVNNSAFVTLSGGAQAKNVFWQVSGQATLGTSVDFEGIILSKTLISLNTGAVMNGRALAQTAVTLNATAITAP